MQKDNSIRPVVKWVGGKRQILDQITNFVPKTFVTYYEPFLGGGAVLLTLQPQKAVVGDLNKELINVYQVIKENVTELISELKLHKNTAEYFYSLREIDRVPKALAKLNPIQRAARVIYLNKTCYNGLYRVNRAGEFNTPFGNYKRPNIVNETTLRAVSHYFNKADITFLATDFEQILKKPQSGDFVYLDPPYDPISNTANFTGYNQSGFDQKEQLRLKKTCDKLNKRDVKFLLSNSATDFIFDLYKDYQIEIIKAKRPINSNAKKRGEVAEVLVRNY